MRLYPLVTEYHDFVRSVFQRTRYRYEPRDEAFLKTVEEIGRQRVGVLKAGTVLYRAQRGCLFEATIGRYDPFEPERMIPLKNSSKEGRVNPKGIPCLYLADNPQTAMSEVRPWIGAHISLGYFQILRDLTIMDCTEKQYSPFDDEQVEEEVRVWGEISHSFSVPVTDSEDKADYALTQVFAEVFRAIGCVGLGYKSLLGPGGHSVALFNLDDAKVLKCAVHRVVNVNYQFESEQVA